MIGKTISHYKILEKLGSGGMGVVYKAEDLNLERLVALKFLPPHIGMDAEEMQRFIQEAKAASALDHTNICTIYEINITEEGQLYICMAYYLGETVKKKIEGGPLKLDEAINISIHIGQGLAKAHEKNIIHRDIKSANILITNDGIAKILDFGLAKLAGQTRLTKDATTLGTIAYMSPEQAKGEDVDHRTDIWSLGVILYEMSTGQLPFKGDYEQAIIFSIINEQPVLLTGLRTGVPIELDRIVNKAFAKNPDERYQHIDEMLVDLELLHKQIKSGENIEERPKEKTAKKKKIYVFSLITSLTIIIILLGIYLFSARDIAINSLAVLPLDNLSDDPGQEYFVDGITDVLISELAQISALRVISRTSSMQYKGVKNKPLAKIAKELNVDAILEGTVYREGERVRITAQLIRAIDDRHLWADKYEYNLKDIFSLQSEVAQAIAREIKIRLTDREKNRLASVQQVHPETYQLYLKGRYHWNERTEEGILKAIDYFKQAIEKDSNYAAAYAGLADCYIIEPMYYMALPKETIPQARVAALRALEIDNKLAEAYVSLAAIRHNYDWAWSTAETIFKKAISLNPNYATAHQWYAELLCCLGRHEEAIRAVKHASELDPLSPVINMQRGMFYLISRDYNRAIKELKKALELHPNFYLNHEQMANSYSFMNMHEEAIKSAQKAKALSENPHNVAFLGYVYARAGKKDNAIQALDTMMKLSTQELSKFACDIALIYIGLNDNKQAFYWLEEAFEQHDWFLSWAKAFPAFDPIRSDPRFFELLKKMGLEK
jgi:serine/threonine-protein kinase